MKRFIRTCCCIMWACVVLGSLYLVGWGIVQSMQDKPAEPVCLVAYDKEDGQEPYDVRYLDCVVVEMERTNDKELSSAYQEVPCANSSQSDADGVEMDAGTGENPAEQDLELVLLDTFIATAYCDTGYTASGAWTTENHTLAVNPNIIPLGTHVWLYLDDGTLVGDYIAEDTGGNLFKHPYVVDIYMGEDSYDECIQWGAQHVSVYVEKCVITDTPN